MEQKEAEGAGKAKQGSTRGLQEPGVVDGFFLTYFLKVSKKNTRSCNL